MNYSKHVVKFNLFNAFRNRYPIDNFEFIETNMRPWGAVYFEEFEVFVGKFSERPLNHAEHA